MDWLHFIGRCFYPSHHDFQLEAERLGVARIVPLQTLKRINYGDLIHLFQRQGKSSIYFGYFAVESVFGEFADAVILELEKEGSIVQQMALQEEVDRLGEHFRIVQSIRVSSSLPRVAAKMEAGGGRNFMIGGSLRPWPPLRTEIDFRGGLRPFAFERFRLECQSLEGSRQKPRGQFYDFASGGESRPEVYGGQIVQISDYRKRKAASPAREKKRSRPMQKPRRGKENLLFPLPGTKSQR